MSPTKGKPAFNKLCTVGELDSSIKGLDADADVDIDDENDDEESDYMSEGDGRHLEELVMNETIFSPFMHWVCGTVLMIRRIRGFLLQFFFSQEWTL